MKRKTAFVTGASGGIGYETALTFARKGYNLVIHYNSDEKNINLLYDEILALGVDCLKVKADLSKAKEVDIIAQGAINKFKNIDVLVNNASVSLENFFDLTSEEEWDKIFDVNVKGTYLITKRILPLMISEKKGSIINVSSIWGMVGGSMEVAYSASKAAIIGLTKALAKEVAPSGIRVNCVAPGAIKTKMLDSLPSGALELIKEETPLNRLGQPKDVADTIFFLASEKADFITGQIISPNGGIVI